MFQFGITMKIQILRWLKLTNFKYFLFSRIKRTILVKIYYHYTAQNPPSTGIVIPFNILDLSLSRNIIASATSSGSANFPNGILSSIGFATSGSDQFFLPIDVITTVGLTALVLIFFGPSSSAITLPT